MKNGLELVPPPPPKAFDWRRLALFAVAVLGVIGAAWIIQQIVDSFSWHRMAVVPLVNHTGDPRLDYLGDGLATVVVGSLIRASRLSVAGISTVQGIPTAERTATKLRHKLGIDGILAGSVTRHADVLHLDLELVEGRHGFTIWAASYDYDLGSSDVVERQIVQDVIQRLAAPPTAERAFWPKSTPPPPGSAYEQVLRAWSALDDPDDPHGPDRALAHVSKALEEDPDFARAWACRSRVLWKLYDRDKEAASLRLAEEAANRAVRLNPELLEARLARAQVYRATSRYGSAISELTDVLRINPNWDEAELHLAAAYRDSGLLVEAESHSLNATDVRPGYWRNWSSLGTVRFLRGDYAGARGAYKKIIDLVPEMNEGYTRLAMVEIKTGNYAAAVRLYDQLPSAVQDGPTANNMGTAYFFEHRLKEARSYYGLAAQVDPRSVDVWLNLGDLHSRAKQPDSARVCYGTALGLADDQLHVNPKSSLLRVQRILSLAKLGRCDEMKSAVAAAVDLLPTDNADIAHRLAKANAVCGRRSESLAAVRRAVALGIPPALLHDEDEFAALVHDPAFPAAPGH